MSVLSRRGFIGVAAAATGSPLLRGAVSPSLLRTPNVQNISGTEATIVWTLPGLHQAAVLLMGPGGEHLHFDAEAQYFDASVTALGYSYYQYRARVHGLARGARYAYQVQVDGATLPAELPGPLEFGTEQGGPFRFLHFADSGEGSPAQLALAERMLGEAPALVLANGDLAYDHSTFTSIESNYYGVYRTLMAQVPFFTTLGNHEYYCENAVPSLCGRAYPESGVPPADHGRYYSFDWGNAHFVALDTNQPLERAAAGDGAMLRWLENDLKRTRQFFRIAFFHHPGFATGKHEFSAEAERVRTLVAPLLEQYGVQLVLTGHEHTYQRSHELRGGAVVEPGSGGTVYVTSGGGGAQTHWFPPNERVACSVGENHYLAVDVEISSLTVRARGLAPESEIDAFEVAPPPRIQSVVNSASFTPQLAAGSLITIFGLNFSPEAVVPTGPAQEALGCSVRVNGAPVPLQFADAVQLNTHIPAGLSGAVRIEVVTPNGVAETEIVVAAAAPALFAHPAAPGTALALSGGSLVEERTPAGRGRPICLFATGLGSAAHPVKLRVRDADIAAECTPSPHGAGLWQVDAVLPVATPRGAAAVQLVAGEARSNVLSLPVG